MDGRKILKLKIAIATLGIMASAVVLWQFVVSDLTAGKRSGGTLSLGLIICALIYGYVYLNFKVLRNRNTQVIFSGVKVIQTVTLVIVFLIGTIMFTIFLPYFIMPLIGFALLSFAVYSGIDLIVFDYCSDSVDGLLGSGKTITFKNLQIDFHDDQIALHALDSEEKLTLRRGGFSASTWIRIVENLNRVRSEYIEK